MSADWEADLASLSPPAHDCATTEPPPDPWRIAAEHFSSLRGCFLIVNVSDDFSPPEYWTAVNLQRVFGTLQRSSASTRHSGQSPTSYTPYYSALRNVLGTAGLLASNDWKKWVQLLRDSLGVDVPAALDHQEKDCGFARRFIIDPWTNDGTMHQNIACEHLPCLFHDENPVTTPSESVWRECWSRISSMADDVSSHRDGEQSSALKVRAKPAFYQYGHASVEQQAQCIRSAGDTIVRILSLQERQETDGIHLQVTCMDVDLSLFHAHESIFKEITKLLEKGVVVNELRLPGRMSQDQLREGFSAKLREAWALLACTICGQSPRGSAVGSSGVNSVVLLEAQTAVDDFFVPLFSALHESRGLRRLKVTIDYSTHRHENIAVARSFWSWLSFALFSSSSTSSVEALDMSQVVLTPSLVDMVHGIVDSISPAQALYQAVAGRPRHSLPPRSVVVNVGTEVQTVNFGRVSSSLRLPAVWTGLVVDDDVSAGHATVLLPGFGFCVLEEPHACRIKQRRIDQSARSEGDAPGTSQGRIHTLSLDSGIVGPASFGINHAQCDLLPRLVQVIGSGLTNLGLGEHSIMSDDALGNCLAACPRLAHLRIDGGEYSPAHCFPQAYARGSRLSSLDLVHIPAPFVGFESFLHLLITDGPTKAMLKNLRIGNLRRYEDEETVAALMLQILQDRRSLQNVRLVGNMFKTQLTEFNGQIVPNGPLPLQHRLAFLSCQSLGKSGVACLDQDTNALIFEFGAPTTKRSVVVEAYRQ